MASPEAPEPTYTVLIRVPFTRGDFVDPPPVHWDAAADRSLWATLSQTPKNSDINWHALAARYAVSLPFLLQQAAYLYDRHFAQVRAQLRRVGASKSSAAGTESTGGGEPMARTASGGRAPSSLSVRRASPAPPLAAAASFPKNPEQPLTRSSSTSTAVMHSRPTLPASPRLAKAQPARRPSTAAPQQRPPLAPRREPVSPPESAASSTSDADSEDDDDLLLPAQSRMLRRPPPRRADSDDDEDDDDGAPTFLPFDGAATQAAPRDPARRSHTSDSSTGSSTAPRHPASHRDARGAAGTGAGGGALAGRRTAELKSPGKGRGAGHARGGSDGTPSMGSSFSDLDDASVTQSALEEALMSNMRHGGMASKMSTFGQAFRSRYL